MSKSNCYNFDDVIDKGTGSFFMEMGNSPIVLRDELLRELNRYLSQVNIAVERSEDNGVLDGALEVYSTRANDGNRALISFKTARTFARGIDNILYKTFGIRSRDVYPQFCHRVAGMVSVGVIPTGFKYDVVSQFDWESGDFSDDDSCFINPQGCYRHHLIALEDNPDVFAFRVYSNGGLDNRGAGRCFVSRCTVDEHGVSSYVLFNAYGISLYRMGLAFAELFGLELHDRIVPITSDVYINAINARNFRSGYISDLGDSFDEGRTSGLRTINGGVLVSESGLDMATPNALQLPNGLREKVCPMCSCPSFSSMYYLMGSDDMPVGGGGGVCQACYLKADVFLDDCFFCADTHARVDNSDVLISLATGNSVNRCRHCAFLGKGHEGVCGCCGLYCDDLDRMFSVSPRDGFGRDVKVVCHECFDKAEERNCDDCGDVHKGDCNVLDEFAICASCFSLGDTVDVNSESRWLCVGCRLDDNHHSCQLQAIVSLTYDDFSPAHRLMLNQSQRDDYSRIDVPTPANQMFRHGRNDWMYNNSGTFATLEFSAPETPEAGDSLMVSLNMDDEELSEFIERSRRSLGLSD